MLLGGGSIAHLRNYHAGIQRVINRETLTGLLLSFHALGHEYRGLLGWTAYAYHLTSAKTFVLSSFAIFGSS